MEILKAEIKDAEGISKNNISMALETENIKLSPIVALEAVENLIKDTSKGFYLLAKQQNQIIGQLMITYEWSDWRNSIIWWIQSVYVKPSFRKKGIFKALYNKVKQLAIQNNIDIIRLYVYNKNYSAIRAYKALGLKQKSYLIFESSFK